MNEETVMEQAVQSAKASQPERFAVIDIETGGFSKTKNGLCEIGMIIIDETGHIYEAWHTLLRPYQRRDEKTKEVLPELVSYKDDAMKVNGLSEEVLRQHGGDPALACKVFEMLLKANRVTKAIGHNIKAFDNPWIEEFTDRFGTGFKFELLIDTQTLAKEKIKGLPSYKLEELIKRFGITNGEAHRALGDCHATRELWLKLKLQ